MTQIQKTSGRLLAACAIVLLSSQAALAAIPEDYLEAAKIDGANDWQVFRHIKLPLLGPTTFFVLVTTIIFASDRAFVPINILTRGGPFQSTTNLSYAIYLFAFNFFWVWDC